MNCNAPPGGDGQSWATAYNNLQFGLGAAQSGDEIWVAAGTYKPTAGTDRRLSFALKSGVALYGGFPASGSPGSQDRDWTANETILSGDIGTAENNSDNSYHVVMGAESATLDGFTVIGGNANGPTETERKGGGMYNSSGSPAVNNCNFTSNSASGGGGGMYNSSGSPAVNNCNFTSNSASDGGAMYNYSSNPTLTNCSFTGNSASDGGAMYNYSSSPTLNNWSFTSNSAYFYGGGMYNYSSSPTLNNCRFTGNEAMHYGGGGMGNSSSNPTLTNCSFTGNEAMYYGGGMGNSSSNPTLTNCSFTGNSASDGGGMYNGYSSSTTVTNCTFTRNEAQYYGGGMGNSSESSPRVTNCRFFGNSASGGGGMDNSSSSPTVANCIFVGNSAYNGGGMYNYLGGQPTIANSAFVENVALEFAGGGMYNYQCTPTVANCILWRNDAPFDPQINTPADANYNDVQGGFPGQGNIDADPLFVSYPSPGGDGAWGTDDDDYGDLHLSAGSPCIDAGANDGIPPGVYTDLDGSLRIWDGNGDGQAVVDMGPYEYGSTPPPTQTVAEAKLLPDGAPVWIEGAIVSAGNEQDWVDFFYIEADDRSAGIRVEKLAHGAEAGARIDLEGTIATDENGERYVEATGLTQTGTGNAKPLFISNRSLGGGDFYYDSATGAGQKGTKGGVGLINIGLFVSTTGRVTHQELGFIYIDDGSALDDGSGYQGVKLLVGEGAPPDLEGRYVAVVGISSCVKASGDLRPLILTTNGWIVPE